LVEKVFSSDASRSGFGPYVVESPVDDLVEEDTHFVPRHDHVLPGPRVDESNLLEVFTDGQSGRIDTVIDGIDTFRNDAVSNGQFVIFGDAPSDLAKLLSGQVRCFFCFRHFFNTPD